jgi:asparagine synthase (glutamine-hydrolysing)
MCGLIGAVALGSSDALAAIDDPTFALLTDELAHRGPDGRGVVRGEGFLLGHRRLGIVDLSDRAAQPMRDAVGRFYLLYNGMIYNFRELRRELVAVGCIFRGHGDTEVVLQAFARWGTGCFRRFDGMFALAVYDRRERRLVLARDRLGIKPLYYAMDGDRLVFCSEVRGIRRFPGPGRPLCPAALSAFLSYRQPLGTDAFFAGVRELPAGAYLVTDGARVAMERYWRPRPVPGAPGSLPEAAEEMRRRLGDAVRRQLVGDVGHVVFLSGGLDSTAILAEAAAASAAPERCITARFPGTEADEGEYAELAARAFAARVEVVPFDEAAYAARSTWWAERGDAPPGMHNEAALVEMSFAARRWGKIALCGEGADELFFGYGRLFRSPHDYRRLRLAAGLPPRLRAPLLRLLGLPGSEPVRPWLDFFLGRYAYFDAGEKRALLRPEVMAAAEDDAGPRRIFAERVAEADGRPLVDAVGLVMLTVHLPGLLRMLDATTMAAGIEARVPFLDNEVVDLALSLPARFKLAWRSPLHALVALGRPAAAVSEVLDTTKLVLRRAYAARLPRPVVRRRKQPFAVPLALWVGSPLVRARLRSLRADDCALAAYFDMDRLAAWYEARVESATALFARQVWVLLHLERWLRLHA